MVVNLVEVKKHMQVRRRSGPGSFRRAGLFNRAGLAIVSQLTKWHAHLQSVIATLDHKHLDLDVPYFKNVVRLVWLFVVGAWLAILCTL